MPLWKSILAVVTTVFLSLNLSANDKGALQLEQFNIGCDFRKFRSKYKKQVKCNQTLYPLIQTVNKKETWNRTVNCSSEKGVSFDFKSAPENLGQNPVADLNAVFESKKLIMLEYIFDGAEFDLLKNSFTAQFGPPAKQHLDNSKDLFYTEWIDKDSKIEIQLIPLRSRLTENGVVRIDKQSNRRGVRVRLTALDAQEDN